MSDTERDPRVAGLLTGIRTDVGRFVRPAGVAAVETTVRQRRRTRIRGAAVLAAALVWTPALLLNPTSRHLPTPGADVEPSASVSTAPSSPSPSAAASPSASPSAPPGPDRRIGLDELKNATLDIPAWPKDDDMCATGRVRFTNGQAGGVMLRGDPVYVDVDQDGAAETAMLVGCFPQWADYKVLVFTRNAQGDIVTFGQVVASAGSEGSPGAAIETIWAVAAGDSGRIRVDVGEYRPCCAEIQASQHQWRTYGWNGRQFTQTGGPTVFGPNPNAPDLAITADRLVMVRQPDGSWQGSVQVTLRNNSPYATPGWVQLWTMTRWQASATADSGCTQVTNIAPDYVCRVPAMPAGTSRVVTLRFTAPAGVLTEQPDLSVAAVDGHDDGYPDPNGQNNLVEVTVAQG